MKDVFGKAILDYQLLGKAGPLLTETSISEEDFLDVAYLFRDFSSMPKLEQTALQMATGKTLDAGCGAGSHSVYLQNVKKLEVTSLDISPRAIRACELRGLKNTICEDLMNFNSETFDTILLLMNGAGICGRLSKVEELLQKLKSLLREGGQILLDSSDIIYMYDEDNDGGKLIPGGNYYGELTFYISYQKEKEIPFDWLYIDFDSLKSIAESTNMNCELIIAGEHYDYLARITLK